MLIYTIIGRRTSEPIRIWNWLWFQRQWLSHSRRQQDDKDGRCQGTLKFYGSFHAVRANSTVESTARARSDKLNCWLNLSCHECNFERTHPPWWTFYGSSTCGCFQWRWFMTQLDYAVHSTAINQLNGSFGSYSTCFSPVYRHLEAVAGQIREINPCTAIWFNIFRQALQRYSVENRI